MADHELNANRAINGNAESESRAAGKKKKKVTIRQKIESLLGAGVQSAPVPPSKQFELVSTFGVLNRAPFEKDPDRLNKLQPTINLIHKAMADAEAFRNKGTIKSQGSVIFTNFNSPHQMGGQKEIETLLRFERTKQKNIFAYDVETFGDIKTGDGFHIVEIAFQELERTNKDAFRSTNNRQSLLIKPTESAQKYLRQLIRRFEADPYIFNTLDSAAQVSLVNLMRYSTIGGEGISVANLDEANLSHNSIINSVYRKVDNYINAEKLLTHKDLYLKHIKSGFQNLISLGERHSVSNALERLRNFYNPIADQYFVSYNGVGFDIKAFELFGAKNNTKIDLPQKHIDWYRLLTTAYPSSGYFHYKVLGRQNGLGFEQGAWTLNEMRRSLGMDTSEAHLAMADVDDRGLGGVFSATHRKVYNEILKAKRREKKLQKSGSLNRPPVFTWSNNSALKIGQTLFSPSGVMIHGGGEYDFQARIDENGNLTVLNPEFQKTVLNARTFYKVDAFMELKDNAGNIIGHTLRLYDEDNDIYTYINRYGHSSMADIQTYVQQNLYNWDGISKQERLAIREERTRDRARRDYERLTSLAGAGAGKTYGFEAAKRAYANVEVYEKRVKGGKRKYIEQRAAELMEEEAERLGVTDPKEREVIRQKYIGQLMANRISHEEMLKAMDFNSQAVYKNGVFKGWTIKPEEQESFFRMAPRLMSERERFQEAMKIIEEHFPIESMSGAELEKAKQRRDMAFRIYARSVDGVLGRHVEEHALKEYERHGYTFMFDGRQRRINFLSLDKAEKSIWSIVREAPEGDPQFQVHRLYQLINALQESGAFNRKMANRLINNMSNFSRVGDMVQKLALEMMNNANYLQDTVVINSLKPRDMTRLTADLNMELARAAIQKVLNAEGKVLPGGIVKLAPEIEQRIQAIEPVDHISGLKANNRDAIATVINAIHNTRYNLQYELALNKDPNAPVARIVVFRPEHSTSVTEAIESGRKHPRAVEIDLPLINSEGYQIYGKRNLIGHSVAIRENGMTKLISTAQMVGMQYAYNIEKILSPIIGEDPDYELANYRSKRFLDDVLKNVAASSDNPHEFNDAFEAKGVLSDFDKMTHVRLAPAYIHDMIKDMTLKEQEAFLTDDAFYWTHEDGRATKKVKTFLTMDHVRKDRFNMLMGIIDWANSTEWEGEKPELFFNAIKENNAARAILSTQDLAEKTLYGRFINLARPNMIQRRNFYSITEDVAQKLSQVNGYVNLDPIVETESNWKFLDKYMANTKEYSGVNVMVAYMDPEEVYRRTMAMMNDAEGREILREEGILVTRNGQEVIDPVRLKSTYENLSIIQKDLMNALAFTDSKRFDKGEGTFQWHKKFVSDASKLYGDFAADGTVMEGAIVKPGDVIGRKYEDGVWKEIVYEEKIEGRLKGTANQIFQVEYTDTNPFKFSFGGEKGTDFNAAGKRFMQRLTGSDQVVAVIAPDPGKRKFYGMLMEGQAKMILDELNRRGQEARAQLVEQLQLNRIGIMLENGRFVDRSYLMDSIDVEAFHEIADQLGVKFKTDADVHVGILEMRLMRNPRYFKTVDETGRAIIGRDEAGNKIYARGERDGVAYGHREMNVLERIGATKTYEHVFNEMRRQGLETGKWVDALNTDYAIMALAGDPATESYKDRVVKSYDFNLMPEVDLDDFTIKGTILDHEAVARQLGVSTDELGKFFWLDLNTEVDVELEGKGKGTTKISRIPVPVLNHYYDESGKIRLRDSQQLIANINNSLKMKARSVGKGERGPKGPDYWDRRIAADVKNYLDQLVMDATSSKGLSGEGALKVRLGTSASGLMKTIDPFASQHVGDEVTWISVQQAKDMGIYEKLIGENNIGTAMEEEILNDWTRQQYKYAEVTRFPTKSIHAKQYTRIVIDPGLTTGNIATTAFSVLKLEGDNDGDESHVVVIDKDEVQKEWKRLANERKVYYSDGQDWKVFQNQWAAELAEKKTEFDLKELAKRDFGSTVVQAFEPNSDFERASKLDKTQVGKISNLNRALQDYAAYVFGHDSKEYRIFSEFGSELEQVGIDSAKAGVNYIPGQPHIAAKFRNALLRYDWNTVREVADIYGEKMDRNLLEEVIYLLDKTKGLGVGLNDPAFSVGSSTGVNLAEHGIKGVYDVLHTSQVNSVQFTRLKRRMLRDTLGDEVPAPEPEVRGVYKESILDAYETLASEPKPRRPSAAEQILNDATGGWIPDDIFSGEKGPRNQRIALFAGLALAGVMGYNVLSNTSAPIAPAAPPPPPAGSVGPVVPQPALPPVQYTAPAMGAKIAITAKGEGSQRSNMPPWIQEGMRRSGFQGQMNMTVNYSDNTRNLSRIWYRDKVEEYI